MCAVLRSTDMRARALAAADGIMGALSSMDPRSYTGRQMAEAAADAADLAYDRVVSSRAGPHRHARPPHHAQSCPVGLVVMPGSHAW